MAAIVGGLLWILLLTGQTFTHGSTQTPREAAILGLESLDFWRLLALPPILWIVALASTGATRRSGRRLGQIGLVTALLGLAMVALGVVLETWILDPDEYFHTTLVQSGWILYLFGLFPMLSLGMFLFAAGSPHLDWRFRVLAVVIGLFAPLPWLEMFLSAVSTGSLAWDVTYSVLRGLLGGAWILWGLAVWSTKREELRRQGVR